MTGITCIEKVDDKYSTKTIITVGSFHIRLLVSTNSQSMLEITVKPKDFDIDS